MSIDPKTRITADKSPAVRNTTLYEAGAGYSPDTPVRIEYSITDKGRALEPILDQMSAFSMKYCAKEISKDGEPRKPEFVYGNTHAANRV